jgi:hypothetical protein
VYSYVEEVKDVLVAEEGYRELRKPPLVASEREVMEDVGRELAGVAGRLTAAADDSVGDEGGKGIGRKSEPEGLRPDEVEASLRRSWREFELFGRGVPEARDC